MHMHNRARLALSASTVAVLLLVGGGCQKPVPANDTKAPTAPNALSAESNPVPQTGAPSDGPGIIPQPRVATFALRNVGTSKQSGSVTVVDLPGNQTRIDIALTGPKAKSVQPAAIYAGTCKTQQAEPQYVLNPVVNGKSSTTLDINIGAILDKAPQALKVRQDGTTPNLPFAVCGDLR